VEEEDSRKRSRERGREAESIAERELRVKKRGMRRKKSKKERVEVKFGKEKNVFMRLHTDSISCISLLLTTILLQAPSLNNPIRHSFPRPPSSRDSP
jgi:polynucleotide 5'-kinase involved in rRNA processing